MRKGISISLPVDLSIAESDLDALRNEYVDLVKTLKRINETQDRLVMKINSVRIDMDTVKQRIGDLQRELF